MLHAGTGPRFLSLLLGGSVRRGCFGPPKKWRRVFWGRGGPTEVRMAVLWGRGGPTKIRLLGLWG